MLFKIVEQEIVFRLAWIIAGIEIDCDWSIVVNDVLVPFPIVFGFSAFYGCRVTLRHCTYGLADVYDPACASQAWKRLGGIERIDDAA